MEKMNPGDLVFVYHSGKQKSLVGLAEVSSSPLPDPKSKKDEKWLAVHLTYMQHLVNPLPLADIKASPDLQNLLLLKQSRLSVMFVDPFDAALLLKMTHS